MFSFPYRILIPEWPQHYLLALLLQLLPTYARSWLFCLCLNIIALVILPSRYHSACLLSSWVILLGFRRASTSYWLQHLNLGVILMWNTGICPRSWVILLVSFLQVYFRAGWLINWMCQLDFLLSLPDSCHVLLKRFLSFKADKLDLAHYRSKEMEFLGLA